MVLFIELFQQLITNLQVSIFGGGGGESTSDKT
jgi:hypothetical protein